METRSRDFGIRSVVMFYADDRFLVDRPRLWCRKENRAGSVVAGGHLRLFSRWETFSMAASPLCRNQ